MLTDEQQRIVLDWINERLQGKCPICQGKSFTFHKLAEMPVTFPGPRPPAAEPIRVVPVSCAGCSYTILLSEFFLLRGRRP